MLSYPSRPATHYPWRSAAALAGGWVCGVMAVVCLTTAFLLGSVMAGGELFMGPENQGSVWVTAAKFLGAGLVLGAAAYALFLASERASGDNSEGVRSL